MRRDKKVYVAPAVEVIIYVTDSLLAGSYNQGNGVISGGGDEEADSDIDQLSARRRGSWGNLWE